MRVSSSTFPDNFLYQTNQLQNQQNKLQQEATTGLKLSLPEDNPSGMAQVLQSPDRFQRQHAIPEQHHPPHEPGHRRFQHAQQPADHRQQGRGNRHFSRRRSLPRHLSSYATQVGDLIQQALQLANSGQPGQLYLWRHGHQHPAFHRHHRRQRQCHRRHLQRQHQSSTGPKSARVSPSPPRSPAPIPPAPAPPALFTDSRSGADLFNHLISLQQDLISGNTTAISSTDAPNMTNDQNNIVNQISANGVLQARLQATTATETQQYTDLTAQISDKTDANLATTLTNLQQTQTAFQAALQSSMMVMNLTILDFIQ